MTDQRVKPTCDTEPASSPNVDSTDLPDIMLDSLHNAADGGDIMSEARWDASIANENLWATGCNGLDAAGESMEDSVPEGDVSAFGLTQVTLEEPNYEQLRLDRRERTRNSMRVSNMQM